MKKILAYLPTQSLVYLLLFGAVILIFTFMILIPAQKTSADLDRDIAQLSNRIEEQRILKPVFDALLKRARNKSQTGLPVTPKTKLDRGDIGKISEQLQEIVQRHDLKLKDMKTDVNAFTGNSGYLLMRLDISGDFMRFRDFLIDVGTIPSLEHIEDIKIQAVEGGREISLKLWLAQK
jgi:hypothetical protein